MTLQDILLKKSGVCSGCVVIVPFPIFYQKIWGVFRACSGRVPGVLFFLQFFNRTGVCSGRVPGVFRACSRPRSKASRE